MVERTPSLWNMTPDHKGLRLALHHYLCLWLLTIARVSGAPANSSSPESVTEIQTASDVPTQASIPIVDIFPSSSSYTIIPSEDSFDIPVATQTTNDPSASNVILADLDPSKDTDMYSDIPSPSSNPIVYTLTSSFSHTIIPSLDDSLKSDAIQTTNDLAPSNVNLAGYDSIQSRVVNSPDSTSVNTIRASKTIADGSSETFSDITSYCKTCSEDSVTESPQSLTVEQTTTSVPPSDKIVNDPNGPPYSQCTDVVSSWYAAQRAKREQKGTEQTTSKLSDRSSVGIEITTFNEYISKPTEIYLQTITTTDTDGTVSSVNGELSFADTAGSFEYNQTESGSTSSNWAMTLTSVAGLATSMSETILISSLTQFVFESTDDMSSILSRSLTDVIEGSFVTATSTSLKGNNFGDKTTNSEPESSRSKQPIYIVYYNFSGVIVFCETTELPKYLTPKTASISDQPSVSVDVTPSAELTNTTDMSEDANAIATESHVINPTATSGPEATAIDSGNTSSSGNGESGNTTSASGSGGGSGNTVGGGSDGSDGVGATSGSGGVNNGDGGGNSGTNNVDGGTTSPGNNDDSSRTAVSETIETTTPYSRRAQAVSQPELIGLICGLVFCVAMVVLCTCLWKFCCKGPSMTPQLYKYKAKILKVSPVPPTPPPPSRQKLVFIAD